MIIHKYLLDISIFNPWKIFCKHRFHEVYKTIFIRHFKRRNELIIENATKYRQKSLGFRLWVVVSV